MNNASISSYLLKELVNSNGSKWGDGKGIRIVMNGTERGWN